jgi:diphthamide biosynthesis enzyme Dph1/Dph2-like protein
MISDEYEKHFNFEKLKEYLKANEGIKNIALQFDSTNNGKKVYFTVDKSLSFYDHLTSLFPEYFFFIVGETSYSPCCADEIAAMHLKTDLIIRIGESCLTKNKELPVYFLNENIEVNKNSILNEINKLSTNSGRVIVNTSVMI